VLHDEDPCCYSANHIKNGIREYNSFIQSIPELSGWMQTYVTAGNIHQFNLRDKSIVVNVIEMLRRYGRVNEKDLKFMPFDLLQISNKD
jgi:hypothetical protein